MTVERKYRQKEVIKYSGIHMWARRYIKKDSCCMCQKSDGKLHLANISKEYKREISDWKVLCVRCHSDYDGKNKIPKSEDDRIIKERNKGRTFLSIAKDYEVCRKAIEKRYKQAVNNTNFTN